MVSWRKLPTRVLTDRAEVAEGAGKWELAEKIWEELENRDAQAEANRGGMNGIAPDF